DDLDALCMALLAPDPEGRPTATDVLRQLGVAMASDQAPAPGLAEGPEMTPLVGREAQLRELERAFDAAGEGRAISVRVAGLSGLGKSAVVHHFLDEIERRGDVVVLRGRAYERESVPYKAVDSVVDALTRHLIELQDTAEAVALPADVWALSHVFPVLRRVRSIDEIPASSVGDPQIIRAQAFGVLRELFATLCKRRRVVVFIDDVQWGDTDSAALLVELMRPPSPPPLMLVTTHRAEEEHSSQFLADVRARWPEDAEVHELTVGPLEFEDARRMALALLTGSDDASGPASARETAEGIARESGGSPFLLEELARSASGYHRLTVGDSLGRRAAVTLEQMLGDRASRLPDDARRLLEVVAVSGRPLPVATVGAAAHAGDQANQLVALLRARRFVRAGLREGREMVEASHDRICQTIVAGLAPETARGHHAQLARVLEATPESDPEAIATHLLGAGDKDRAAHYAERAAEQAVAKLAFAQASRLYQMTLDTLSKASPEVGRLARRTAEAAEWAGLAEKAARAYLVAAAAAPTPLDRMDLERAAASQLTAAGLIDEGATISYRVLAAVRRNVPRSVLAVILSVIFYRIASVVIARRKLADPRDLEPEERLRLEAMHAAQRALAVVDPFSANYVKARYLVDALRSGSRAHIIRAAAAEASTLAGGGGVPSKRERTLFEMALTLSKQTGDQEGYGLYLITYGVSHYLRGRWRAALDMLDPTVARLAAVRRWNANASIYAVYALTNLGDLREVKTRTLKLLVDAEQRGDLYSSVNLRASHPMAAWLASDDVDGARRHLRAALGQWSKTRYLVQHWQAMIWETEVDLYSGEGARAWDRLGRDAKALKSSFMLVFIQLMRVFTHFVRGRAAIASLESMPREARRQRLEEARRAHKALAKEGMPWTLPLAEIVKACIARADGDATEAEAALRRAITLAERAEMPVHANAARRQLGVLVGGEAGQALVLEADEIMKSRGVRQPSRYAGMLVPGQWAAKTPTGPG
ncbi:MAG TPA: AAA family ATPase, partial [Polyangiaceae bacterium]|nr:AAA family ATPase [Polyangiaceae bacterium]